MNYKEQIHELLDGTLDHNQEEQLFIALSVDESLRNQLREFINIDIATKNDFRAFQPNPDSQSKIFATLGIPLDSSINSNIAPKPLATSFWSNKYNFMVSSLASAILGAAMMFLWINNTDEPMNISSSENNDKSSIITNLENSNHMISSNQLKDTVYLTKTVIKYITKPIYLESNNNLVANNIENSEINNNTQILASQFYENDKIDLSKLNNNVGIFENKIELENNYLPSEFNYEIDNPKRFSLEVRNHTDWSINKTIVHKSSVPALNNTSLNLNFRISNNLKVGIEGRQEYFYQEYDGIDNKFQANNYYQYTNYIGISALMRYSFLNYKYANVFIQPAVGLNQVGIIGRTMIGSEIKLSDNILLILGLEGSMLQFKHQDKSFYSPKFGLHYGIQIKP